MRSPQTTFATCCAALLLAGCRGCEPERPRTRPPPAPFLAKPAVLAVLPPGEDTASAPPAERPHATYEFRFSERGGGVVWIAPEKGGKVRVFHDGHGGPAFEEVGNVALSPDGLHHAYGGRVGGDWHLMVDGKESGVYKDLGTPHYSPDGAHLLFTARLSGKIQLVVDGTPRWATSQDFAFKRFTADSSRIVFFEVVDLEAGRLVVADLGFRAPVVVPGTMAGGTTTEDLTRVAAIERVDGGVRVLDLDPGRPDRVHRGKTYERVANLNFGPGGSPLGYLALRSGQTLLVIEDDEIPLATGELVVGGAAVEQGRRGFGALVKSGGKVTFKQYLTEAAPPEPSYEEAFGLAYSPDGRAHAYAARRGTRWFVVANGKEGPPFEAVRPPEFSSDGKSLVYRARREGRRFVVIAEPDARSRRELPPYEQVFDVRFTADGRSIAYGVKDGRELAWKVEPLQ